MAPLRVFLSHSHLDNSFCQRLVNAVRQQRPDADIFFDLESLIGGDEWLTRIQREVIARPLMVVVLSLASVKAEWVREEVNMAFRLYFKDTQRRIIPVLHQECDINQLAPLLLNRQYIDCATQNEMFGFSQLTTALQTPNASVPIASNPAYEDARRRAGEVHDLFSAQDWREVARLGRFASTLPGNERDAELWGELGISLIRVGQAAEGVQALDQALRINRFRVDLWREKATALLYQLHQPEAAISAWDMAMAATVTPQGKFDLFAEECEALNHVGRWRDALALNLEAERINPTVSRIWVSRGDSLLYLREPLEATNAYDYALTLDPRNMLARRGKCFALVQVGDFATALPLCDELLASYPTDGPVWSNKAKALAGLGRLMEAQQSIDRALANEPQNASYLGEKAQYLISARQYGAALPLLDQAIAVAPTLAYLWQLKAVAFHGLRRFDEARAAEMCARELSV